MKQRWRVGSFVALLGLLVAALPAHAQSDKYDEAVRDLVRTGGRVRAIARFTDEASRTRVSSRLARRGARVGRALNDVGGLSVDADASALQEMASDPGVAHISIDATVRAGGFSFASARRIARTTGARAARDRFGRQGGGVAVAVIDSGVQPHADLPASRIRAFVDFVNGRTRAYDDYGHGTHVAGIVAGTGAASAGQDDPYQGVAPGVDIVALKVLDAQGAGATSDVIAALEWVAANHRVYNIRVVNLSLGHPVFEPAAVDPLVQAAEALVRRGIVVVASAGNLGVDPRDNQPGYGGITSPANGPSVIAVGAVDTKGTDSRRDDTVTEYSSRGPTRFDLRAKPDLVAPGHRIVSLASPGSHLFTTYPQMQVFGGRESVPAYFTLSGTSMAAPAVSGAAALLVNTNPRLTAATVRAVLQYTSQRLANVDALTQGAGYLNVLGATRLAGLIEPGVRRGQYWLRTRTMPTPMDTLDGEPLVWGRNIVWGDRLIGGYLPYLSVIAWDDNIVWGQDDNVVWGQDDNVVWGQDDNVVWGQDNVVWGQNIVWAENIVWGDNIVWGYWAQNVVWGFWAQNVVWGQVSRGKAQNIVWGQDYLDNIVWGQDDNVVWGQNIVWGYNVAVLTGELQ